MSKWGKRLQEIRLKHKLTQSDLAKHSSIDTTAVSRYERGRGAKQMPTKFKDTLMDIFSLKEIHYIDTGIDTSQSIIGDGNTQAGRDNHLLKELDNIAATVNDPLIAALVEIMKKTDDDMKKLQVIQYATEVVLGKKE